MGSGEGLEARPPDCIGTRTRLVPDHPVAFLPGADWARGREAMWRAHVEVGGCLLACLTP